MPKVICLHQDDATRLMDLIIGWTNLIIAGTRSFLFHSHFIFNTYLSKLANSDIIIVIKREKNKKSRKKKKYSVFQKKTVNYKFCNPQNTI